MSKLTHKIGAFAVTAAIGVAMVASMPAQARSEPLSTEQKIERTGNKWAQLFAADNSGAISYQSDRLDARFDCARTPQHPRRNCTLPSSAFRESFEDARVIAIKINGRHAAARFSNGVAIELLTRKPPLAPFPFRSHWAIDKVGGNAGRALFE